jgi:hypothetical protein
MTQPAQQEYIITNVQLKKYEGLFFLDDDAQKDFKVIRSRPHTPTPQLPRHNTQPKGTTCEDCQRFRKEECPYPESNITITRCNSFLMDVEQHDTAIRNDTLDKLLTDICKQCPIRNEEMPLEDYSAETCEVCLTQIVVEQSLRTQQEHP